MIFGSRPRLAPAEFSQRGDLRIISKKMEHGGVPRGKRKKKGLSYAIFRSRKIWT